MPKQVSYNLQSKQKFQQIQRENLRIVCEESCCSLGNLTLKINDIGFNKVSLKIN